ncbi:MAG: amidohydrolase family protein [Planctomycetaceae bacterium]|nr:amidohydrolase family protein [Planctomycetaceae bacterium]
MTMENRRTFLRNAGTAFGAFAVASRNSVAADADRDKVEDAESSMLDWPDGVGLPQGWRQMRKLDAHNHVMQDVHKPQADWSSVENLVAAAQALGINKLYCSRPVSKGILAEIAAVRDANDSVLAAMKRFPGQIEGYCFVQPGNGPAALDEIERCLEAGMIGVKLYNQFKYTDPIVFPVVERCIERRIPILGHSAYLTDAKSLAAQPLTSHALDFCELSGRYPELILILGHVNGGGDWEWAIKGLRDCPNVYLDTSGSVLEDDTIGRCVLELGHRRILFATDLTMEGGVGKILSAELTLQQREDIFWRNFQGILDRRAA